MILRVINVAMPVPNNSSRGAPQCPYIKIQLRNAFSGRDDNDKIIAVFVISRPSLNCFAAVNMSMGIMPQAITL